MTNYNEKIMKSHEDKILVNVSPILISRADSMESLFIQKSIYGLTVSMKPTIKMIIAASSSSFVM